MKKTLLCSFLLLFSFVLQAQTKDKDCPYYITYIEKGKSELKKGDKADYKKAIEAFSIAMIHCPANADEARANIMKAFDAINSLKKQAENDKATARRAETMAQQRADEAEYAKKQTEAALKQVEGEKDKAEKAETMARQRAAEAESAKKDANLALRQADSARQIALAALDKIYFYQGKFGLAYDNSGRKFGFIDKNLNTKIDFKYDNALPFDNKGWSKVKKGEHYYLIDTIGNEYRLATDINQLNYEMTALDLRDKKLSKIPTAVFQQTQLKILLLNDNAIEKIPKGMKALVNLRYLELSNNKISRLEGLDSLEALQQLNISSNQISKLENLGNLGALQQLNISINKINKLEGLDNLRSLQQLDVSYNIIAKLESLDKLKSLQLLNIRQNFITELEGLENLRSLQQLDLSYNKIIELNSLNKLTDLQQLDISMNSISKEEQERIKKLLPNCEIRSY